MNYFIINPKAGSNKTSNYRKLIAVIETSNSNIIYETNTAKEATLLAKKALEKGASKIIAVGGDGTINEVASALVGSNIPLGIIPIGSGNGLARHLGIPMDPFKALTISLTGNIQKIDVGQINEKYFFCTAGIGFDASVAHQFAKGSGRGLTNYIKATFKTLFNYKPILVSINEGPYEEVFSLTIANANQFGNNAFISPYSNIQDGLLEIIKIKKLNIFQAASIGMRLFLGNINTSKSVEIISSSTAKIKYKTNAPLHLDGEHLFTPSDLLNAQISAGAIQVIT
jgi:diacylglycerol kinase (ATP)